MEQILARLADEENGKDAACESGTAEGEKASFATSLFNAGIIRLWRVTGGIGFDWWAGDP
jgi:hypothetical protein